MNAALLLGSSGATRAGSIPVIRTNFHGLKHRFGPFSLPSIKRYFFQKSWLPSPPDRNWDPG